MTKRAARLAAPASFQVRWSVERAWEIEDRAGSWEPLVTGRGAPRKHAREKELVEHARNWARSMGLAVGRTVEVVVARWPPRGRVERDLTRAPTATPWGSPGRAWRLVFSSRRAVVGTFVTTGITVPVDVNAPDAPERLREDWGAEVARRAAKNGPSN